MDRKELQRICEAILFAAGEPVETERLCFVTQTDPDELQAAMRELMDLYAFERRGIRILRLEDSWQMCSQNDLAPLGHKGPGDPEAPQALGLPAGDADDYCLLSTHNQGLCGKSPGRGQRLFCLRSAQ